MMTKVELLKQIEPGDEVYFDFGNVSSRYFTDGWYEYESLSPCSDSCHEHCPGSTAFKGLKSDCLVWNKGMPVTDIRKRPRMVLPDELFEIEI